MCLDEAKESYHSYESQLIDILSNLKVTKSEWHSSFRAILRKPLSFFLKHKNDIFSKFDEKYGVELNDDQFYESDDYKSIHNLVNIILISISNKNLTTFARPIFSEAE